MTKLEASFWGQALKAVSVSHSHSSFLSHVLLYEQAVLPAPIAMAQAFPGTTSAQPCWTTPSETEQKAPSEAVSVRHLATAMREVTKRQM